MDSNGTASGATKLVVVLSDAETAPSAGIVAASFEQPPHPAIAATISKASLQCAMIPISMS
jgi:hypothetical protein